MASQIWSYEIDSRILSKGKGATYVNVATLTGAATRHQVRGRHLRLKAWMKQWLKDNPASKSSPDRTELFLKYLHGPEGIQRHRPKVKDPAAPTARMPDDAEVSYAVGTDTQDVCVKLVEAETQEGALEEAIKKAKVDLSVWHVERWKAKKYSGFFRSRSFQTPGAVNDWRRQATVLEMWSVEVSFTRRSADKSEELDAIRESLLREVAEHSPALRPVRYPHIAINQERFSLELFAPDPHHGKLAWEAETGTNYESSLSEAIYSRAIDALMQRATGLAVEEILLPLGNDFFHVDTPENTTTAGTRQDVDSRWQKTFRRMKNTIVKKVEQLRQIAPVKIVIIPGNHDQSKMFFFGDTLESWFRNAANVTIDNTPPLRKYHNFGINLIGWSHGDKEKFLNYPMLMAHEAKQAFARSRVYEWHLGHLHKREEKRRTLNKTGPAIQDRVMTDTIDGVTIRRVPSLGGTDAWHHAMGYCNSPRQADLFLWSKDRGLVGTFTYTYLGEAEKAA
jgi:hypothetical protein